MSRTEQKQQENKYQKEYEEKFDEIKSITSRTKQAYVPILCKLIKKGWPDETADWRQNKVCDDCSEKLGWNYDTVYKYIPSEFHPRQDIVDKRKQNALEKISKENAPKVEQALRYFDKITELSIRDPPEAKTEEKLTPLDEQDEQELYGYGLGKFGDTDKSPRELLGDVTDSAASLFEALMVGRKKIPHAVDADMIVDYIKPTREEWKSLMLEADKTQRARVHNWLSFLADVIEDRLEILSQVK